MLDFADTRGIDSALARASHILSTVPPLASGEDPVLAAFSESIAGSGASWVGYLSSTGVYGDARGAWVDETAALRPGRANARADAESAWRRRFPDAAIFRLPGIYGPGRSALSRAADGRSFAVDKPGHVFSRVHVDDIVAAVELAMAQGAGGIFNVADDEPASGAEVSAFAHRLLGLPPPALRPIADAGLSQAGLRFYAECRRVSNGKARRLLGFVPRHSTYRSGLRACLAEDTATRPSA